ncbi:response regulator [Candidatus Paracaedibacter symbiosus]|uniref:response regulator n=1 Tax=Candidatus Paracaedibacter symbiosus TaxID=244582 RepID=UPI00068DED6A|nr:response regulator [Candidatus Paracaedibacter symbiosus]
MSYLKALILFYFLIALSPLKASDLEEKKDDLPLLKASTVHDNVSSSIAVPLPAPSQPLTLHSQSRIWGFTEDELERLFEQSQYIFVLVELPPPMKFRRVSREFCRLLGWSKEELLMHCLEDYLHPDDVKETQNAVSNQLGRGIAQFSSENRYYTKNGDFRWFRWVGLPENCSEPRLILGIAHDITEEKMREAEIKKLNQVLWNNNIILKAINKIGEAYVASEEKEAMFSDGDLYRVKDISTLQLITRTFIKLSKSHNGFLKEVFYENGQAVMSRAFEDTSVLSSERPEIEASLKELFAQVLELRRPLIGNHFFSSYSCLILPLAIDPSKLLGVVALINNSEYSYTTGLVNWLMPLTEKASSIVKDIKLSRWLREAEKESMRRKEEELELQRQAREKAEEANKMKTAFVALMSHETRTPLNAIIGFAELSLKEELTDTVREYLNHIYNASQSLLTIANDVIDVSRIEANALKLERKELKPATVLQKVYDLLKLEAQKKDLRLKSTVATRVPEILVGDEVRLQQILLNLGNNAIKFTNQGKVSLRLDGILDPHHKNIFLLTGEVKDTGMGIDAKALSRLFQPFSQADNAIMRQFGGTGLGLYITKQLCEKMNGTIQVISDVGLGSTFRFTVSLELPGASSSSKHKDKDEAIPANLALPSLRILVAEDNRTNQRLMQRLLHKIGCDVVDIVANGKEALEAVLEKPYDVILMDGEMPVMDGLQSTRQIRTYSRLQHLTIIGVSAHAMSEHRQQFIDAGMNGYVPKPVKEKILVSEILRCIPHQYNEKEGGGNK